MALGLGSTNPMPFTLGGGASTVEDEHNALLDALSPGWDIESSTEVYAETYADAIAISMIWAISKRLRNQAIPSRMLESLPTWEAACTTRPGPDDPARQRRARVAAKLRGVANNALYDIEQAAMLVLGDNFDLVVQPDPANWIVYWPGLNPGPPGFEWSSNRARIGVRMNETGLTPSEFEDKRARLARQLDAMCPAWMTFAIGVGSAFNVNIGLVGTTFL